MTAGLPRGMVMSMFNESFGRGNLQRIGRFGLAEVNVRSSCEGVENAWK